MSFARTKRSASGSALTNNPCAQKKLGKGMNFSFDHVYVLAYNIKGLI